MNSGWFYLFDEVHELRLKLFSKKKSYSTVDSIIIILILLKYYWILIYARTE